MKIQIRKEGKVFVVDPVSLPGSPAQGRGVTFDAALGDFLRNHQERLHIEIEVHETAMPAEEARRRRAMARR
jgi:hypothetical protein